ncbi:SDR family oxidoreductase [Arthrobacter oryzae]|uniref:SDR family oxidoreductase n=1 Tax=Arthrobacter oryzae TaxID=409290 RepID=UPI00273B74A8|nr:SDR family oxidoreductase [Arthrobacter oryzae]WLQ07541.1 SDR family oxidoreductase [Arthrobacter oryzae]
MRPISCLACDILHEGLLVAAFGEQPQRHRDHGGGARVITADISEERLDALVEENPGLDQVPVAGDISTEDTVAAVVTAAGGRVDALANVAGIMDKFAPIDDVDYETWDRVFRINVTAPMRLHPRRSAAYTASKHRRRPDQEHCCDVRAQGPALQRRGPRPHHHKHRRGRLGIPACGRTPRPADAGQVPTPASPAQLAASTTVLLSDDGINVNGAIQASDGGWSAL